MTRGRSNPKREPADKNPDKLTGRAGPSPKGQAETSPHPQRPLSSGYGQGPPDTPGGKTTKAR